MGCPATGGNSKVWFVQEVVQGVTPDTPVWNGLVYSSFTPTVNRDKLEDTDLSGGRDTKDFRTGNSSVNISTTATLKPKVHDDFYASAFQSSWIADELQVAASPIYFSFMIEWLDIDGGIPHYDIYRGVTATAFTISIGTNQTYTNGFTMLGKDQQLDVSVPVGSTFVPAEDVTPYAANDSVVNGGMVVNGVLAGFVTAVSPSNDNDANPLFSLGEDGTACISTGRAANTFSIDAYFDVDTYEWRKFAEDETEFEAYIKVSHAGNDMEWRWKRAKMISADPDISSEAEVTLTAECEGLAGPGGSSLIMTRTYA